MTRIAPGGPTHLGPHPGVLGSPQAPGQSEIEAERDAQRTSVPNDPFGTQKDSRDKDAPSPAAVAKIHKRADTDSSQQAIHHSLGLKNTQASPGDHTHNGITSKRLLQDVELTGATGGNVALQNLIALLEANFGLVDNTT